MEMELGGVQSRMEQMQVRFAPGGRLGGGPAAVKVVLGYRRATVMRMCSCRAFANIGTMSMDWRPALDEILLMSSVLLAYVAGVVNKPLVVLPSGKKTLKVVPENTTVTRRKEYTGREVASIDSAWDSIDEKLEEAVSSIESGAMLNQATPALFLQALAYGPRLRLLLAASNLLRNEVTKRGLPMSVSDVCGMVGAVCRRWLSDESARDEKVPSGWVSARGITAENVTTAVESGAEEYTAAGLQRSGKVKLYTDFLFFLCKQSLRPNSSFNVESSTSIIEDIIVAVSDGAAVMYLDSVSSLSNGWPTLLHSSISSTRSLEKFRNEVALQLWIYHNFDSVAAIYEDRLELWTLKEKKMKKKSKNESGKQRTRLKKQTNDKVTPGELTLTRVNVRCRRNEDLKALYGWRYWYSLYLELSDIVGPLFRILVTKLGQGLSFLLVCLIGRSFGLIYQGIRQSVKWSSE